MSTQSGPAQWERDRLLAECQVQRTRRGGPGGQHRNKVETAVVITWLPQQIVGQASERRDQKQNFEVALQRLRVRLALAVRSQRSVAQICDQPDAAWAKHIRGQSLLVNSNHADYPTLLSELLDLIHLEQGDLATAKSLLGVTGSQLVKFLSIEPAALDLVNQWRLAHGQKSRLKHSSS